MKLDLLLSIASLAASVAAEETVVGAFILMRHGDRLAKPSKYLTPLGAQQCYSVGQYWRERYLSNSSDYHIDGMTEVYNATQLTAYAPNSDVLQKSALAFLQGLYPPTTDDSVTVDSVQGSSLSNGSYVEDPLDGYQYVYYSGEDADSEDGVWLEGGDNCPAWTTQSDKYYSSDEFLALNESTLSFYQNLSSLVAGTTLKQSKLNFENAYSVFDFFNVQTIHNETFAAAVSESGVDMNQIKYLSDVYSRGLNYNSTEGPYGILTLGARNLAYVMEAASESVISGSAPITFTSGSYDTFYQMWGYLGMYDVDEAKYTGLVNYASQLVIEFVRQDSDSQTYARVLFRNGTDADTELETLTLPRLNNSLPTTTELFESLGNRPLTVNDWCSTCAATSVGICQAYFTQNTLSAQISRLTTDKKLAAGLGVSLTFVATALAAAVLILFLRRRWLKQGAMSAAVATSSARSVDTLHNSEADSQKAEA